MVGTHLSNRLDVGSGRSFESGTAVDPGATHFRLSGVVVDMSDDSDDAVRVWLVERTYSDDEQNLIILTYATPDGERYFRKERALTSFTDVRDTTAAVDVDPDNLGTVGEPELIEQYATEATRMAEVHDPDDPI